MHYKPLMVECSVCHTIKVWTEFYLGRRGVLRSKKCKVCYNIEQASKVRTRCLVDPEFHEKLKEKYREFANEKYVNNPDHRLNRQFRSAEHCRIKYATDDEYRASVYVKVMRRKALVSQRHFPVYGFTDFVLLEARKLAALREKFTGIPWDVDHVVPLKGKCASGLHIAFNFSVIPRAVNRGVRNMEKSVSAFGLRVQHGL